MSLCSRNGCLLIFSTNSNPWQDVFHGPTTYIEHNFKVRYLGPQEKRQQINGPHAREKMVENLAYLTCHSMTHIRQANDR